jgi:hypothetical protein
LLVALAVVLPPLARGQVVTKREAARGALKGGSEPFSVVVIQPAGREAESLRRRPARMAVETMGRVRKSVCQVSGRSGQHEIDAVTVADLDADGVPEILALWWEGQRAGAELRVFHWSPGSRRFVEVRPDRPIRGVQRLEISVAESGLSAGQSTVTVFARSGSDPDAALEPVGKYKVQRNNLVTADRVPQGEPVEKNKRTDSGVHGLTVVGPLRPVERLGDPQPNEAPFSTELTIVTADEEREVARLKSGSDGRFRVVLPPGEYVIKPARTGRMGPRAEDVRIRVLKGEFTFVRIVYDSGMR